MIAIPRVRMIVIRRLSLLAWVVFALLVLSVIVGCNAGQHVRDNMLAPALAFTADGLEADVLAGIDALPVDDRDDARVVAAQYFDAVRSGDRARMIGEALPAWPSVKQLAMSGVAARLDAGLIGPLGSESKLERVRLTEEAIGDLLGGVSGARVLEGSLSNEP